MNFNIKYVYVTINHQIKDSLGSTINIHIKTHFVREVVLNRSESIDLVSSQFSADYSPSAEKTQRSQLGLCAANLMTTCHTTICTKE